MAATASVKLATAKKWVEELDPGGEWLKLEAEGKLAVKMRCQLCATYLDSLKYCRNFNRSFADGVSKMKKDAAAKHQQSDMHKHAMGLKAKPASIDDFFSKTRIGRSIRSGSSEETKRVRRLMEVAYVICKTESPFTLFPHVCHLMKRQGVDLGSAYLTDKKAAEFSSCIAEVLKDDLKKDLNKTKYYTIFIDGSTDVSTTEREMMYISYILEGLPKVRYMKLEHMTSAGAESITAAIKSVAEEFGLTEHSLVAFCSDGASVNFGSRSGVVTRLREDFPELIAVHCMNHRLELAAKDAFKGSGIEEVLEILNALYAMYSRSPKRWEKLKELAAIMEEDVQKPLKANGTRWVQFKHRAVQALIKSYPVIVAHLEDDIASAGVLPPEKAKLRGYLKRIKSVNLVFHLLLLQLLIAPLASLSESLQKDVTQFNIIHTYLTTFYRRIQECRDLLSGLPAAISDDEDEQPEPAAKRPALGEDQPDKVVVENVQHFLQRLHDLIDLAEDGGRVSATFKKVQLDGVLPSPATLEAKATAIIDKVKDCVLTRLGAFEEAHYHCLKLLDTGSWPHTDEALEVFGMDLVLTFIDNFSLEVTRQGCDTEQLADEFERWKILWKACLRHLPTAEAWQRLLTHYSRDFPNLCHMVTAMLLVPASNAIVERGFSAMNRVKTDYRNGLGTDVLDDLLRITLDGPPEEEYDASRAAECFRNRCDRRPGPSSST